MTTDQNKSQVKRYPKFANFGEYLFWSYANLQMLCAALNMGKAKYDRSNKHPEEMDAMELPFKWQYILDYPQPECFM